LRFFCGSDFGTIWLSGILTGGRPRERLVFGCRCSFRLQSAIIVMQRSICRRKRSVKLDELLNAASAIRRRSTNFIYTVSDSEMSSLSENSSFNCRWISITGAVTLYFSWTRFNNARSSARMVLLSSRFKIW
jgi:hypothetical protein